MSYKQYNKRHEGTHEDKGFEKLLILFFCSWFSYIVKDDTLQKFIEVPDKPPHFNSEKELT